MPDYPTFYNGPWELVWRFKQENYSDSLDQDLLLGKAILFHFWRVEYGAMKKGHEPTQTGKLNYRGNQESETTKSIQPYTLPRVFTSPWFLPRKHATVAGKARKSSLTWPLHKLTCRSLSPRESESDVSRYAELAVSTSVEARLLFFRGLQESEISLAP